VHQKIHHIIIVIFFIILLFSGDLFFIRFKILQKNIRNQIQSSFSSQFINGLQHLIINNPKQIQWRRNNEILYNGILYDIFIIKREKNNTIYYCIQDEKEQNLIDYFFKNLIAKNKKIFLIFFDKKTPQTFAFNINFAFLEIHQYYFNFYNFLFLNKKTPPPEC